MSSRTLILPQLFQYLCTCPTRSEAFGPGSCRSINTRILVICILMAVSRFTVNLQTWYARATSGFFFPVSSMHRNYPLSFAQ